VKTLGRGPETINLLDDVQEEMLKEGFGDSDNEVDGVLDNDNAMVEAMEERHELAGVEEDKTVEFNDHNSLLLQKGARSVLKLPGAPPPPNWSGPTRKEARGKPIFSKVNNPGRWHEFTYHHPVFLTKGDKKDVKHVLPTGASPVTEVDGKRTVTIHQHA
jgi:hypothetical protein